MNYDIRIKDFTNLSNIELYDALKLRNEIFVVEQNCAYQDMDGKDELGMHVLIYDKDILCAYARIFNAGISYSTPSIGRVVVKQTHRKLKLGKLLMNQAIQACYTSFGEYKITISAQQYLEKFYTDLGFVTSSEMYLEDDIPHIKMIK